ncbi:MAG: hypothetical protein QOF51_1870, partial [Chloroflexota bacterium]|nr:hypothetical protein [Chloroflexota bacterium]
MKLIIQIPCYNEAADLPSVLAGIPRVIPGIDCVEVLVVDDGSTDGTEAVAYANGADHVVRHPGNRGLAAAFRSGLDAAIRLGADVVVNTDGDNQYPQEAIPSLVAPILAGKADVVIGDRNPGAAPYFSPLKRWLQRRGAATVRMVSGTDVADPASGFRAFSREAALRTNVLSTYSYTMETVIQAGASGLRVVSVPIGAREVTRPSRLMRSMPHYLAHSGATIIRAFATYRPLAVFMSFGALLITLGLIGIARFVFYYFADGGAGHVQSVVLAGTIFMLGWIVLLNGLLADLIAANRRLTEEALVRLRRLESRRDDETMASRRKD